MDIGGVSKIANTLARMQNAGGLSPMQNSGFDKMFANALDTSANDQTNKVSALKTSGEGLPNFDNMVVDYVNSVNQDQYTSGMLSKKFINGEDVELHEVMIAGEKAKTSLDLLVEIRNRAIDMYRELTRLQG